MKVVLSGLDLSDAAQKVVKAIASKTVNPALECIRLTAKGDTLTLTATDMEFLIEKKVKAEVFMEGEVLVKGKYFTEFIQKLDKEEVELSLLDEGKLNIKYTDAESSMPAFSAEEFPSLKTEQGKDYVTLKRGELKDLIGKVVFSCSTDDARPLLKGVLIEVKDGIFTAVALDGFRLALCKKHTEEESGEIKAVIPSRCLMEISRFLEKEEEPVTLSFKENGMVVELDDTKVYTRLLEGNFIDYEKVIPNDFLTNVVVNKAQIEEGIARASICARGDKNNLIRFDIRENCLSIFAETEIGKVNENILVNLVGKDLSIAFNGRYVSEALKAIGDEFIKVYFNNDVSPCVIKPCSGEDYLYLILPVRISN